MNLASMTQQKKYQLARSGKDYVALLASDADFIVRSKDDLTALRQSGQSPLAKLKAADFAAFLDSLEFKGGGVAHGQYKPLMNALSLTEIFQVFEHLGMDKTYAIQTWDYSCVGDEGCQLIDASFCSSACQEM